MQSELPILPKPLSGLVVLLTNADNCIGCAIALALAESGADIALTMAPSSKWPLVEDLRARGARVEIFPREAMSVPHAAHLVRSVIATLGRIDIVVSNAERRVQWQVDDEDLDEEAIEEQLSVNVRGTISLIRAAARVMQDGGRIIALGASLADRVGTPGLADFAATRAAIAAFCRGAAHDLGPRGITVNVVQVGAIESDFQSSDPEVVQAERDANVLKRLGKPSEVANAVVFLAGPGASFITGSILNVDGGYNA